MINAKLEEIRRSLVDLTRNNRLLNHRSKGQRSLAIYEESAADVYRHLVDEERTMQFLAREEAEPGLLTSLLDDVPSSVHPPEKAALPQESAVALPLAPVSLDEGTPRGLRGEYSLQTLLSGEKLQTRLVDLAREAHSAVEEQGCNILYCTFGMIDWREANASAVFSRAPLVFVPVELRRTSVNTRFTMKVFDDDIVANSSLVELCRVQFRFELPAFNLEKDNLETYFETVRGCIREMPGWNLSPEINIGLYSFTKLQMYRDLDPQNWPDGSKLTEHPIVRCLAGVDQFEFAGGGAIPDPREIDTLEKPAECFQIVDADSSQQTAILAAKGGASLVIDGPPGTGKSQTITNIIAECLAAGRTVLFVSEKAAALDVVKRRLTQVGLADSILELHSRQASKRVVLEEINRVLAKRVSAGRVSTDTAEELEHVRDRLNSYSRELHEPFGGLNISPFEAISRAIKLSAEAEAVAEIPDVSAWTVRQLAQADEQLRLLDRRLARVGDPAVHPWRGVGLGSVGVREKQQIRSARDALAGSVTKIRGSAAEVAMLLGRVTPSNVRDITECLGLARSVADTPIQVVACIRDDVWNTADPRLRGWLDQGHQRQQLREQCERLAKPDSDQKDWRDILRRRECHGRSVLRLLRPSWYSDTKKIASALLDTILPSYEEQIELLKALVKSGESRSSIEQGAGEFTARFGSVWAGIDGDWQALIEFASHAVSSRQLVTSGQIAPTNFVELLEYPRRDLLAKSLNAAQLAMNQIHCDWTAWLSSLATSEKQWLKADWSTINLDDVSKRLSELTGSIDQLEDWVDLRACVQQCSNSAIKQFVVWILGPDGRVAHGRIAEVFKRHFYRLWIDYVSSERSSLRGFRGQDHEAIVNRFRELDRRWLNVTRDRLSNLLATKRPATNQSAHRQSKLGLLQAEARKKTRHMSLRKLLAAAGEVVQSIKPCFMMSPLSVAQYLAPGGLEFDVVIFDEASQVEPADAYGAVVRGKQLILVGDERQLPPTNFFSRVDAEDVDSEDEADVRSIDLESILSLGIVRFRHRCGLRWHYRSRHSSLIEFSNQKFYDGQLRVFPSPHTDCTQFGLAFRFVENAVYLRGAGRYNPVEATTVAEQVIRHAVEHPELSLGVGTLNQPQQRAVEDEIERLRRTSNDPRVEQFFAQHLGNEAFFVKNLENIQGDERDVIFLSVCFGKDASGRFSVALGALNGEGGWRRLNVLITRARQRCLVFSSIRHDDIDLGNTKSRGVIALKEYLYAAEHGRLKEMPVPGGDHDSDFEAAVCRSVRDAGWEVHAQVGCAGFSIDLAVVDPRSPGRYLLGIECDGATYHSSPTARDRDRLRQAVLEDLGWCIHRIWSTDWFQRPRPVLDVLIRRLKALSEATAPVEVVSDRSRIPSPPSEELPKLTSVGMTNGSESDSREEAQVAEGVVKYLHMRDAPKVGSSAQLFSLPIEESANIVRHIVDVEGPIHVDEALRAYAELFNTRASARPRGIFLQAVAAALQTKSIIRKGDFLWSMDHREVRVRSRTVGCPVVDSELIPPEEFEAAVKLVVRQQFGLKFDAVDEAVARLFGFARTGTKLRNAVEQAIVRLDQRGELQQDRAGFVTLQR